MKKVTLAVLSLMIVIAFAGKSVYAGHEEMQEIEGNVICLIPDYAKGTVKPVLATEPCDGMAPHAHVLVGKDGKIYSLQGLDQGLMKIQKSAQRSNVKIMGKVEGNSRGWVLYVQ